MALSVANFTTGGNSASVSSITAAAQNTTTGNLLVVGIRKLNAASISTVADTAGNTFIPIPTATSSGATAGTLLYYAKNITGNAANVVTITFGGATTFTAVAVWEIAGADRIWPLGSLTVGPSTSGATITSRTYSTANANEIAICMAQSESTGVTFVQGAGFSLDSGTFPTTGTSNYCGAQHQIFSVTQNSVTASMTLGSSTVSMSVATFVADTHTGRPVPVVNFAYGGSTGSLSSIPSGTIPTTAGNMLVAGFRIQVANMGNVTSVTDTAGNVFTAIPGSLATNGSAPATQLWYVKNIVANAANVVTVALSVASTFTGLAVWEIAGADLAAPLDTSVAGIAASGTTVTTSAFSTAKAKEIALAFSTANGTNTFAAGGSYTLDAGNIPAPNTAATPSYDGAMAQSFTALQSSFTASMTYGVSGTGLLSLAAFLAATLATPTFSPVAGTYGSTQSVTVSCTDSAQPGFAMFYTTDGSTPTTGSTPYTGPITVSSSQTLKVLATSTGLNNSAIASAAYVITGGGSTVNWVSRYRKFKNKR